MQITELMFNLVIIFGFVTVGICIANIIMLLEIRRLDSADRFGEHYHDIRDLRVSYLAINALTKAFLIMYVISLVLYFFIPFITFG